MRLMKANKNGTRRKRKTPRRDDSMVMAIRMPIEDYAALSKAAKNEHRSISNMAKVILAEGVGRRMS